MSRALVELDRKAPCRCQSGKKYKSCCYPRDRTTATARTIATGGLRAVDEVLKVFLPLVESRGEHTIACREGCSACCNNFVRASLPEALVIAEWLAAPEHAEVRARFSAKLPAWRTRAGDEARAIEAHLARAGGAATAEGPDWEHYNEIGLAYARKGNMCPFNAGGRCEIYPVRPTICRTVHVVDTAEYCTPDRGGTPKVVSHPSLVATVHEVTRAFARASFTLCGVGEERALPEAVAWALDR